MNRTIVRAIAGVVILGGTWSNLAMGADTANKKVTPEAKVAPVSSDDKGKMQKTDVEVTPAKPYVLPDKTTKILIKKDTIYLGRGKRIGIPQLVIKDLTLDIVPNTVIASGGQFLYLTMPYDYKFGHIRESDMIMTVIDSCKFSVIREKKAAPVLLLKKLKGDLEFSCSNRDASQLKSVHGDGKHFVALRVTRTETYRRAPSNVLGTGMDLCVVNSFGAKRIRLEYMQEKVVTIGPETVTIKSFDFEYKTKSVKIKVTTKPKAAKAEALIVEYGDTVRLPQTTPPPGPAPLPPRV